MFIKRKKIVDEKPFGSMKIYVLASSKNQMQIQVEKSKWDDFFFDLDPEEATALRDSLDQFLAG